MGVVASRVDSGVKLVDSASASLREIRAGTSVTLERISDVACATNEQSAASTVIAQQVEQIAMMVEGTSQSMRTTVDAVAKLENLSTDLNALVGRFRY